MREVAILAAAGVLFMGGIGVAGRPARQKPESRPAGAAAAPEPAPDPKWAAILGEWSAEDRHLALGSLFQPRHGTRQREAVVYFRREGDRLMGHCIAPDYRQIVGQESWEDGRTDFRSVRFEKDRLTFEFDAEHVRHGWQGGMTSKGWVPVEAALAGDRLLGRWLLVTADGTERFRGEWEAIRAVPAANPGGG